MPARPPGPTPTPTPIPVSVLHIGAINDVQGGAEIVPSDGITPSFNVTDEYLEKCSPEAGGYFVVYDDIISYLPAENFEARFPQS